MDGSQEYQVTPNTANPPDADSLQEGLLCFFIDPASAGFTGDPQGFAGVMLWVLIISVAYIAAG